MSSPFLYCLVELLPNSLVPTACWHEIKAHDYHTKEPSFFTKLKLTITTRKSQAFSPFVELHRQRGPSSVACPTLRSGVHKPNVTEAPASHAARALPSAHAGATRTSSSTQAKTMAPSARVAAGVAHLQRLRPIVDLKTKSANFGAAPQLRAVFSFYI